MAAPTWIGKGTFTSGTGALTVPWPTAGTYAVGDLALLFVESANEAVTTPSGWTQVSGSPVSTGTAAAAGGVRLTVFRKLAASTSEASVSVADTGNHTTAQIHVFRGVDSTYAVDDVGTSTQAATSSMVFPGVSFADRTADALIVFGCAQDTDAASAATCSGYAGTGLTNITERHDQTVSSGVGGGLVIVTANYATTFDSSTPQMTATGSTAVAHAYITLALYPESPVVIDLPPGEVSSTSQRVFFAGGDDGWTTYYISIRKVSPVSLVDAALSATYPTPYANSEKACASLSAAGYGFNCTPLSSVGKLDYAGETTSLVSSALPSSLVGRSAVSYAAGDSAVLAEGFAGQLVKFLGSTETGTTLSASLAGAYNQRTPVFSATKGYFVGGIDTGHTVSSGISSVVFSNDTYAAVSATASYGFYQGHGMSSAIAGYLGGRRLYSTAQVQVDADKFIFSSETLGTSVSVTNTAGNYAPAAATATKSAGFFTQPATDAYSKLSFASETYYSTASTYGVTYMSMAAFVATDSVPPPSLVKVAEEKALPAAGSAVLVGTAPTAFVQAFDAPKVQTPDAGVASVSGLAPAVSVEFPRVALPDQAGAFFASQAPTLITDYPRVSQPGQNDVSFAGLAPTTYIGGAQSTVWHFRSGTNNLLVSQSNPNFMATGTGTDSASTTAYADGTNSAAVVDQTWLTGRTPPGGQTIIGTISFTLRAAESSAAADAVLGVAITRVAADGTWLGSVAQITGTAELGTSFTDYVLSGSIAVSLAENERLQFSVYADNTSGQTFENGESATLRYGGATGYQSFVTFPTPVGFEPENVVVTPSAIPLGTSENLRNAYLIGGTTDLVNTTAIDVVSFASHTSKTLSAVAQANTRYASFAGGEAGYFFDANAKVEKLSYATESTSVLSSTPAAAIASSLYQFGFGGENGYFAAKTGGAGTLDRLTVATDTIASVASTLSSSYSGSGSEGADYFGAGKAIVGGSKVDAGWPSTIPFDEFNYATETASPIGSVAATGSSGGQGEIHSKTHVAFAHLDVGLEIIEFATHTFSTASATIVGYYTSTTGPATASGLTSGVFVDPGNYNLNYDCAEVAFATWTTSTFKAFTSDRRPSTGFSRSGYGGAVIASVTFNSPTFTPAQKSILLAGYAPALTQGSLTYPVQKALTLGGLAPSLGISYTFAMPVRSVALAGQQPTTAATASQYPQPGVGALVVAGQGPSSQTTSEARPLPGAGALALSGLAPSLGITYAIDVAARGVVLTGLVPAASATAHQYTQPGAGSMALAGYAPTLFRQHIVQPGVFALAFTKLAPDALDSQRPLPGVGSILLSGFAPTSSIGIVGDNAVLPAAGYGVFTGYAASLSITDPSVVDVPIILDGAGGADFEGFAPDLEILDYTQGPLVGSAVAGGYAPDLAFGYSITPPTRYTWLWGRVPSLDHRNIHHSVTGQAPSLLITDISAWERPSSGQGATQVEGYAPSVSIGGHPAAARTKLALAGKVPLIRIDRRLLAGVGVVLAQGAAPSLRAGVEAMIPAGALVASGAAPTNAPTFSYWIGVGAGRALVGSGPSMLVFYAPDPQTGSLFVTPQASSFLRTVPNESVLVQRTPESYLRTAPNESVLVQRTPESYLRTVIQEGAVDG